MLFQCYPSDAYQSLKHKLASEQRTSLVRCKVIGHVWALQLKYITVFPRGKQNDAVKWSSVRFVSSIKTDVSYTCWLSFSALCLVMAVTNQKKKTQLAKRCSNRAIANQVLPRIDLSSLPNQGWSCNVYPFLSVAVAASPNRPCPSSGALYSPKKLSGLALCLSKRKLK